MIKKHDQLQLIFCWYVSCGNYKNVDLLYTLCNEY